MFVKSFTVDKILRGKISIIQLKKGFRYGFDTVFLAAFVNGYLKKLKKNYLKRQRHLMIPKSVQPQSHIECQEES